MRRARLAGMVGALLMGLGLAGTATAQPSAHGQHRVPYTKATADSPVMPDVVLNADLVMPDLRPRPEQDREPSYVEWTGRLRYLVAVVPRFDPVRQRQVITEKQARGRTHHEVWTWTSPRVRLGEPVRIPWTELRSTRISPLPSGSPEPFTFGGGELFVEAQVFRSREGGHPVFTGRVEPDGRLTRIYDRTAGQYRDYVRDMSPGSRTLRIEGQLAHVVSARSGAAFKCEEASQAGNRPDEQPGFKCDPVLKGQLVAYLQNSMGTVDLATQVRDSVVSPATDPNGVIRGNLFRLIAYKESKIRHFNDLTQDGSTATLAGVPKEAVWPLLNTIGKKGRRDSAGRIIVAESRQTDGGYGIMQLTDPHPTYAQVWDYRRNIDEGIRRFAQSYLPAALRRVQTLAEPQEVTIDQLRYEMYLRYNEGSFTKRPLLQLNSATRTVSARDNEYVESLIDLEECLLDQTCRDLPEAAWGTPRE